MIIQATLVFLAVALADVFWTQYFLETAKEREHHAALYSALIILVSAYITRSFVHDGILIIPAVIGAYVGTAGTIKYHKWKVSNASK